MERVHDETSDPAWNIENHPARKTLERFDYSFGAWVNFLMEMHWLRQAGYPLTANDLSYVEWKCLAVINQWHLEKTKEQR